MPRKSSNTERGSIVGLHKRQRQQRWRELLVCKQRAPFLSLRQLAHAHALDESAARKRFKAYQAARAAGQDEDSALDTASRDARGGSNRVFTPQQEALLGEIVRGAAPSLTHTLIQQEALRFQRDCEVSAGHGSSRHLRSAGPLFTASDGFVSGLKRRQRLSSHRTAVEHKRRADPDRDTELEKIAFVVEVRDAIDRYGPALVLNMDETPVPLLDAPITAVVATASKKAAKIHTPINVGTKVTTFPTISASGVHLPLCAILKGKTPRCLRKVQEHASVDVKKVQLYYSEKGWVNEGIMALYFRDVLLPYTHCRPAALIVDSYRAHFTPAVRAAAAAMELQLIQVPGGCTAELQPLDVNFNRTLLMKRKQIWARHKLLFPFAADSAQAAIERAQAAYADINESLTAEAFRSCSLID